MDRGLLAADGRMAKVSWDWMILAIVPYYLMWVLISIKRENLGNPSPLPNWYEEPMPSASLSSAWPSCS